MKTTCIALVAVLFAAPARLPANEQDEKIKALEKDVEQLKKLVLELTAKLAPPNDAPQPAQAPKPGPSLSIGSSGFAMRSADTNFALRLRGLLQVDSRWYADDGGIADNDGFILRRARPILEATLFRDFDFRFTPEFGGSSVNIRDAWLNYRYDEPLQLRIGKMKSPGSLERWQSVANIPFIERSLASGLWPVRELGVMLYGELWPRDESVTTLLGWSGLANYEIGLFNGTSDGRSALNGDFDDAKTVAGRLFFHPFLKSELKPLRAFGFGVSGSYGNVAGPIGLPDDRRYETEARQAFFSYLLGDGTTPATANVTARRHSLADRTARLLVLRTIRIARRIRNLLPTPRTPGWHNQISHRCSPRLVDKRIVDLHRRRRILWPHHTAKELRSARRRLGRLASRPSLFVPRHRRRCFPGLLRAHQIRHQRRRLGRRLELVLQSQHPRRRQLQSHRFQRRPERRRLRSGRKRCPHESAGSLLMMHAATHGFATSARGYHRVKSIFHSCPIRRARRSNAAPFTAACSFRVTLSSAIVCTPATRNPLICAISCRPSNALGSITPVRG